MQPSPIVQANELPTLKSIWLCGYAPLQLALY